MFRTTDTRRRLTLAIALTATLGVLAVPQALASSGSVAVDGRTPDTRDAALAAHPQAATPVDGRSADTHDFAALAHSAAATITSPGYQDGWYGYAVALTKASKTSQVLDGRSPDTRDFAALAHSPVVTITRSPGFAWGDFGVGAAAALAAMLLLIATTRLLSARQSRKQTSPVATA